MAEKKVEWYLDFVNNNYKPAKTDLIALFYFEPAEGISREEAVEGKKARRKAAGNQRGLQGISKQGTQKILQHSA